MNYITVWVKTHCATVELADLANKNTEHSSITSLTIKNFLIYLKYCMGHIYTQQFFVVDLEC